MSPYEHRQRKMQREREANPDAVVEPTFFDKASKVFNKARTTVFGDKTDQAVVTEEQKPEAHEQEAVVST